MTFPQVLLLVQFSLLNKQRDWKSELLPISTLTFDPSMHFIKSTFYTLRTEVHLSFLTLRPIS